MATFEIKSKEADCTEKTLKYVEPKNVDDICDEKVWQDKDCKIDAGVLAHASYVHIQDGKPCEDSGNPQDEGYYSEDGKNWYYWNGTDSLSFYKTCS